MLGPRQAHAKTRSGPESLRQADASQCPRHARSQEAQAHANTRSISQKIKRRPHHDEARITNKRQAHAGSRPTSHRRTTSPSQDLTNAHAILSSSPLQDLTKDFARTPTNPCVPSPRQACAGSMPRPGAGKHPPSQSQRTTEAHARPTPRLNKG